MLALPVAAAIFMFMVLNINTMFTMIILSRAFLDPVVEQTKMQGGGAGIGALLNIFVIVMVILIILRNPWMIKNNPYWKRWLFFLACCSLTVVFSPVRADSIKLVLNLTTYACIFMVPFYLIRSEADKKRWLWMIFYASFVPIFMANVGAVTHIEFLYVWKRLKSTFTHSNILAFYCVLLIAICVYFLRTRMMRLSLMQRFMMWMYLLNIMAILIITETRSAWISCAVFFALYSVMAEKKLLIVGVLAGCVLFFLPPVQERLSDLQEGTGVYSNQKLNSWAWRQRLWSDATPEIKKKIVAGHGLGSFQYYSKEFSDLEKGHGAPAHNVYVELLFEAGLLGLIGFLAIYQKILSTMYKRYKMRLGDVSRESAILFSYLIGYLMVCYSDNALYYLAFNWYLWFFAGVLVASGKFAVPAVKPASEEALPPAQNS